MTAEKYNFYSLRFNQNSAGSPKTLKEKLKLYLQTGEWSE
jgi:hypothetical protein